ncbi:cytochrome b [Pseudomonas sp. DR48]|uniref:cytochrome b n=1 Tax=Pseudomonas sp. DR48 TaxID=2871095 RepID=UPI0021BDAA9F|nr:cytochrome b/b6 domain-containing protein [Pseudomonas sp. DR48]
MNKNLSQFEFEETVMSHHKYTLAQVALHWLSAFVILWSLCTGSYVALFNVSPHMKSIMTAFNISMTTLFIPFFLMRVVLRINHLRHHTVVSGELLATFVHNLIYLITGMVLLTGVLMMDRSITVFGALSMPPLITNPQLLSDFHAAHQDSTAMLGGLVLLHLLAVVKHELSGNRILKRMSFQTSAWESPLHAREDISRQSATDHNSMWTPPAAAPLTGNARHSMAAMADDVQDRRRIRRH